MRPEPSVPAYPLFARSDLLIALFGSLVMAAAGAGMASWFGHPPAMDPAERMAAFADASR